MAKKPAAKSGKPDLGRGMVPPPPRKHESPKDYDRTREKELLKKRLREELPEKE